MWAVIPVKRFSNAKSRLGAVLSEAERESLAQAMLNDVLRAASQARLVAGVLVVSHEVRARYAVERVGGLYLEEAASGLRAAIAQAGDWLANHGQRGLLMLPGDIPLATSMEIDRLVEAHRGCPAVTIAPDREQDGTNALAVSPADAIAFAFGSTSFTLHCDAARAAGITPGVLHLPGIALDVDNPMDLRALVTYDAETETLDYLSDSGIARRLLARHHDESDSSGIAAAS
ncbi:MAG: 2-phospho-L-lactate guanylyltransferase, partial [Gammaproteobacteria bacterium]